MMMPAVLENHEEQYGTSIVGRALETAASVEYDPSCRRLMRARMKESREPKRGHPHCFDNVGWDELRPADDASRRALKTANVPFDMCGSDCGLAESWDFEQRKRAA